MGDGVIGYATEVMRYVRGGPVWRIVMLLALTAACAGGGDGPGRSGSGGESAAGRSGPAADATARSLPTSTTLTPDPTLPPETTTTTEAPRQRSVAEPGFAPFATVGGITLVHPSIRIERIGLHASNHEGARVLELLPTAVLPVDLQNRERGTSPRTAADVVVDPAAEIRAPVTGVVKRAGNYVLYCKHRDDYAVISPDQHPSWEVKILHIDGVQVRRGQRVKAGETVLAPSATPLPFSSQVDELRTVDPAWPHVHIEVVDPSIPNISSPNSGC